MVLDSHSRRVASRLVTLLSVCCIGVATIELLRRETSNIMLSYTYLDTEAGEVPMIIPSLNQGHRIVHISPS